MNGQDCEQLTLFPADSPANRSVWLESRRDGRIHAICGLKCSELSGNLARVGLSVRTYLESCELPPGTWSRIWSAKAMTSRCWILKLRLSERRTNGQGSRLWQTPNVPNGGRVNPPDMTETGKMPDGRKRQVGLEHQVKMVERGLWPTPAARDYKGSNSVEHLTRESGNNNHTGQLANAVKLWPTVRCRKTGNYQYSQGNHDKPVLTLTGSVRESEQQVSGQLNPTWVEWLMGFPIGWTESDV